MDDFDHPDELSWRKLQTKFQRRQEKIKRAGKTQTSLQEDQSNDLTDNENNSNEEDFETEVRLPPVGKRKCQELQESAIGRNKGKYYQ
ncbi:hypothetical protein EC973_002258 [Apophysomyces ossiformis]|uniref:Uncharacterized protein n=1 Tax=Apophysomyces ossiformis TaxID=679940 RepID=A0A8H7BU23_9FUNG|nr:hypothetical protein EC973_002258 [Apophysomyces ossiformis]